MSLLTDTDIRRLLNREIIIDPFDEEGLTPVGYDLSVGGFVYSLQRGLLELDTRDQTYRVMPGEIILILSKEFVWVSGRVAGTFHSKVSMVSRGFSHIGTTLDPEWKGNLLISIANLSKKDTLELKPGQKYVTLVFYRTKRRATKPHTRPPARSDILMQLLSRTNPEVSQEEADRQRERMVDKFSQYFSDEVIEIFDQKIRLAQAGAGVRAAAAARKMLISRGKYIFLVILHILLIFAIIYLGWNIETVIPGLKQETFFPVAITLVIPVLLSLFKLSTD